MPLPPGFRLALDPDVRRPHPEVLIGGAPLRVLRLSDRGAALIDSWIGGEPVGRAPGAQALAARLLDAGLFHPAPVEPAGAPEHPTLSDTTVVIPVRDRPAGLQATLLAIGSDVGRIIVIDDGSTSPVGDGAVLGSNVAVLRQDPPTGPAAARNNGWGLANTEVVAFVDADCEPCEGWLHALLPYFSDPSVGAVAPRVVPSTPPGTASWLARYEQRRSPLDLGSRPATVRPGSRVPYVPTAALLVRRSALQDVGGFDDRLRYGEDVDLVWRLVRAGWRVRFQPEVEVRHPTRASLGAWLDQRYRYGRSAAALATHHRRDVAPVAMSPWSSAVWGFVSTGHPLVGTMVAAGSAAALARRAGPDRVTARALAELAMVGNWRAGLALAEAVRRAWLPPAIAAVVAGRGTRAARTAKASLAAAFVIPPLAEWALQQTGEPNPCRWAALRIIDDLAYQSGVWAGAIEARSPAALLPRW